MKKIFALAVLLIGVLSACGESETPLPPVLIGTWQYKFVDGAEKVLDQGAVVIVEESKKDGAWVSVGAYKSAALEGIEGQIGFVNEGTGGQFGLGVLFSYKDQNKESYLVAVDSDRKFEGSGVELVFKGAATMYEPDGKTEMATGKLMIMRTKREVPQGQKSINID